MDANTGAVIWSQDLVKEFQGRVPVYGYCCSPLVYRDLLILEANAPGASLMAFNKTNGEPVWKLAGGDVTCGSPILTRVEGLDWVVFSGGGSIVAAEAASGRQLWRRGTWGHCWVGPVVWSNLVFMANASLPRGCGVFEVRDFKPQVLWEDRARKFQTLHCNAVIWQGHIYGVDNTGTDYQGTDSKKSTLKCLDLRTGEVKWAREKVGWGNVLVCDGKLLLLRETGELIVGLASPDAWHELARAQVLPGPTWSPPAISNGRLFCRNRAGSVVCVQIAAPPGSVPDDRIAREAPPAQSPSAITARNPPARQVAAKTAGSQTDATTSAWNPDRTNSIAPAAAEWPRFRGPGGLGKSAATNLPTTWDGRSGRGVLWKSDVPVARARLHQRLFNHGLVRPSRRKFDFCDPLQCGERDGSGSKLDAHRFEKVLDCGSPKRFAGRERSVEVQGRSLATRRGGSKPGELVFTPVLAAATGSIASKARPACERTRRSGSLSNSVNSGTAVTAFVPRPSRPRAASSRNLASGSRAVAVNTGKAPSGRTPESATIAQYRSSALVLAVSFKIAGPAILASGPM